MNIIKCIAEKIEEELDDAKAYVELAIKWKEEYPEAAEMFNDLSVEEMGHVDILHRAVNGIIQNYRAKHGEPPKEMMTLYNYLHERHMATATQIKVMQGMYKMQE